MAFKDDAAKEAAIKRLREANEKRRAEAKKTDAAGEAMYAQVQGVPEEALSPTVERHEGDARSVEVSRRKQLIRLYKAEAKVGITVSPLYAPYVGRVMPLYLNGIYVAVPADGASYLVPESFADMWDERRLALDAIIKKKEGMANVAGNVEKTPGEIPL
jgi:hypothetical protein